MTLYPKALPSGFWLHIFILMFKLNLLKNHLTSLNLMGGGLGSGEGGSECPPVL